MSEQKIKNVYEVTLVMAVEDWVLELDGLEPQHLEDGRTCLPLDVVRAGAMLDGDEKEAAAKAARTAIYFWKKSHPEFADAYLEAQSIRLIRQKLVA